MEDENSDIERKITYSEVSLNGSVPILNTSSASMQIYQSQKLEYCVLCTKQARDSLNFYIKIYGWFLAIFMIINFIQLIFPSDSKSVEILMSIFGAETNFLGVLLPFLTLVLVLQFIFAIIQFELEVKYLSTSAYLKRNEPGLLFKKIII